MLLLAVLHACSPIEDPGVYRSGPNAVAHWYIGDGRPLRLWGPQGTVTRIPTDGRGGWILLGEAGPLWVIRDGEPDLPAIEKPQPVSAALVERAGFRLREVLGGSPNGTIDPDRSAGVAMRSIVKVRQHLAPPVYAAVATRGAHGIPQPGGGRSPVAAPSDCEAALAILDDDMERVVASVTLGAAGTTCAVPVLAGPVDRDGDGLPEVLVHGQNERKGFRNWYEIGADGRLEAGPSDLQTDVP